MADKPIIFSGPMVRAILDGRKSMTRRVLKPQPHPDCAQVADTNEDRVIFMSDAGTHDTIRLPYASGDRLWCRETWREALGTYGCGYEPGYRATCCQPQIYRWRPSIHMPRWASRLTLIVESVKVERLQEISEDDCIAEGATIYRSERGPGYDRSFIDGGVLVETDEPHVQATPSAWFRELWDSLNARRPGCTWADNPWVCAVSFRVIKQNMASSIKQFDAATKGED